MEILKDKKLWLTAAVLLILLAVSYLPNISNAGFLDDDWTTLYVVKQKGPSNLYYHYSYDRPLRGYLWQIFTILFDTSMPLFQISNLVYRLFDSVFIMLILTMLWPKRWATNLIISALTLIFPGYQEQIHAYEYSTHVLVNTLLKLSIFLSLLPFKIKNKWLNLFIILTSIGLALVSWGVMEWFIGLEAFRLWAIYILYKKENDPKQLKKIGMHSLIYLITAGSFTYWRIFLFNPARPSVRGSNLIGSVSTISGFFDFSKALLENVFKQAISPWYEALLFYVKILDPNELVIGISLAVVGGVITVYLISLIQRSEDHIDDKPDDTVQRYLILGGLFIIVGAVTPVIFGGREIGYTSGLNRFALPGAVGSTIFIAGLISYLKDRPKKILLFILIATSILAQYSFGIEFKRNGNNTRAAWWQFTWRAPDLEPATLVSGQIEYGQIVESFSLWAPLNIIYFNGNHEIIISSEVLYDDTKELFTDPEVLTDWERGTQFTNDFNNFLLFTKHYDSCLHMIDGNHPEISEFAAPVIVEVAPYSDIDRIRTETPKEISPDRSLFGPEPAHDWCYFYQKAQLARQEQDWKAAADLGRQALDNDFKPSDAIEWLVFAQAFKYTDAAEYDQVKEEILKAPYVYEQACLVYSTYTEEMKGTALEKPHGELLGDFCN